MKGECYCEWDYFLLVLDILVQFVQPSVGHICLQPPDMTTEDSSDGHSQQFLLILQKSQDNQTNHSASCFSCEKSWNSEGKAVNQCLPMSPQLEWLKCTFRNQASVLMKADIKDLELINHIKQF